MVVGRLESEGLKFKTAQSGARIKKTPNLSFANARKEVEIECDATSCAEEKRELVVTD